ncbi:hypothetical protein K3495_g6109 [Podosphaera aphanis]|nr:hypothetical protein K3495_g6109 [Podosphaera aphanis]
MKFPLLAHSILIIIYVVLTSAASLATGASSSHDHCALIGSSTVYVTISTTITVRDVAKTICLTSTSLGPNVTSLSISTLAQVHPPKGSGTNIDSKSSFHSTNISKSLGPSIATSIPLTDAHFSTGTTDSLTSGTNDPLIYVVINDTTYWLNGQTPHSSQSYVVQTSVVTVVPIFASSSLPDEKTQTVFPQTTLQSIETSSCAPSCISNLTSSYKDFRPPQIHRSIDTWNTAYKNMSRYFTAPATAVTRSLIMTSVASMTSKNSGPESSNEI